MSDRDNPELQDAINKYRDAVRKGKQYEEEGDDAVEAIVEAGGGFYHVSDVELDESPQEKRQEEFERIKGYGTKGMSGEELLERAADIHDLKTKYGLKP